MQINNYAHQKKVAPQYMNIDFQNDIIKQLKIKSAYFYLILLKNKKYLLNILNFRLRWQ